MKTVVLVVLNVNQTMAVLARHPWQMSLTIPCNSSPKKNSQPMNFLSSAVIRYLNLFKKYRAPTYLPPNG